MKVFWSWQADTQGKTGRHFVRAALADAVQSLKQPEDVEEPLERETRETLHLDHDRQGVPGSPDLARTIFGKIDQAAVFVADVTLVAQMGEGAGSKKKLINSNVAIEYGYAVRALGDESILMVQNVHYGEREELPFDLKHKAGPIQYRLAPDASKQEIAAEHAKLRSRFVEALRPYLSIAKVPGEPARKFGETPCTANAAFFWTPSDVLARIGSDTPPAFRHRSEDDDAIDYRFNEPRAFYLRLIPTIPLAEELKVTTLFAVVQHRRLQVLTRTVYGGGMPGRNRFGAISYEPHGTSPVPNGFTQLFRNGEIWGVSGEFAAHYYADLVVPMVNVENIYKRALANYILVAGQDLGVVPPYQVEMGAVGLKDMRLSLPQPVSVPRRGVRAALRERTQGPVGIERHRRREPASGGGRVSRQALRSRGGDEINVPRGGALFENWAGRRVPS
jgi:hypothetical protein